MNSIKAIAWMLGEIKSSIKSKKIEDKKPMGKVETLAPKTHTPKSPIAKKEIIAPAL